MQRLKAKIKSFLILKSKKEIVLDLLISLIFGGLFFSIPACSFKAGLNLITWALSAILLFLMILSLLIFSKVQINLLIASMILFCVFIAISSAVNGFINFEFTSILLTIFIMIVYSYVLNNKQSKKLLIYGSFIGVVLFLALFIFNYFDDLKSLNFNRLGRLFGDENDVALFMAYGFIISFHFLLKKHNLFIYAFFFVIIALFGFCGLSTGSKLFVFDIGIVSIFTIYWKLGLKRWWISTIIVFALGLLFVAILQLPFAITIKERIQMFFSTFLGTKNPNPFHDDLSTIYRFEMFSCGFEMFLRKPLLGYGVNGFKNFGSLNNGWSHNTFSELLCNFGLIGTILFFVPIFYAVISFIKSNKKEDLGLPFALLLLFIIAMFSVSVITEKIFSFTFGVILGSFEEPNLKKDFSFRRLHKNAQSC